jgi:hypothetical protein
MPQFKCPKCGEKIAGAFSLLAHKCKAASASAPAVPRETTKGEKADMSPGNPASDGDEHPPSTPEAR